MKIHLLSGPLDFWTLRTNSWSLPQSEGYLSPKNKNTNKTWFNPREMVYGCLWHGFFMRVLGRCSSTYFGFKDSTFLGLWWVVLSKNILEKTRQDKGNHQQGDFHAAGVARQTHQTKICQFGETAGSGSHRTHKVRHAILPLPIRTLRRKNGLLRSDTLFLNVKP